jgi:tetratricopeptide (TPR) repeat protein
MTRSADHPIADRQRFTRHVAALVLALASGSIAAAWQPAQTATAAADDQAALRALAERWLETQEREDLEAFLALYSPDAPDAERRRDYAAIVFRSGDDRFSDVRLDRVTVDGDRGVVRVTAERRRTVSASHTLTGRLATILACRRTSSGWRIESETSAFVALADELLAALDASAPAGGDANVERLLEAEQRLVGTDLLRALATRGAFGADAGRVIPAYQLVARLARRLGDDDVLATALQNLGNTYYFRRDYLKALELYRERLVVEEKRGSPHDLSSALQAVATAHYALADYVAALDSYRRALALEEMLADDAAIGALLTNVGNVYFVQGDFVGALDAFRRSRTLFERLCQTAQPSIDRALHLAPAARAWHGEGRAETGRGNYGAAITALQSAVGRFRDAKDRSGEAAALSSLAHVTHLRGDHDAAIAIYGESLAIEQASNNTDGAARVIQAIGLVELVRGRFQEAADAYACSRDQFEKARDREGRAYATLGLGFARTGLRQIDEALASYQTASAGFESLGRREQVGRAALGMALAHAARGAAREALETATRAVAIAREVGSRDLEWRARVREGYALLALARPVDARAAFEAGVAIVEEAVDPAGEEAADPTDDDRGAPHVGLAETFVVMGDARAALAAVERARLRRLRDELARVRDAIHAGMTDAERDEERRLVREVVSLGAQIARESRLPKPDAARLSDLRGRLARAAADRGAFTARLYERLPGLRTWRGDVTPAEIDAAIAPMPPPREAIVSFVVSEGWVLALVSGRGDSDVSALVVPGNARALVDKPEAIVAALRPKLPVPGLPDRAAGRSPLVIIPDGFVWRVPFETLLPEFAVTYAGSLTLLERVRAAAPAPDAPPSPEGLGELAGAVTIDAASPFYSAVAIDGREPMEARELFTATIGARDVRLAEPEEADAAPRRIERAAHALQWAFAAAGVPSVMIGRLVLGPPAARPGG